MRGSNPPGRAAKGDKKSEVLSARLSREYEDERNALAIWERWKKDGYSPREIITSALLKLDGDAPSTGRADTLEERILSRIEQRVEETLAHVLKDIRRADPNGLQAFAASNDERDEVDEDVELSQRFIQNAKRAARKSFRQRQGDE